MRFVVIILLSCIFSSYTVFCQTITGTILDTDQNQLEFANILLYKVGEAEIHRFAISDSVGHFQFNSLKPDNYVITISMIGFADHQSDTLHLLEKDHLIYNGIMKLQSQALKEVVVMASRPKIIHKGGKTIVNLENTISIGSNLQSVLKKVPGIIVSKNGLSVGGQNASQILINGRNTNYIDLQTLLRNMSGDNIAKVEVVYQPDATFEASGSEPLINIILKKNKLKGTNGNVSGMAGKSNTFVFSNGVNVSSFYRNLNFSGSASYRYFNWTEFNQVDRNVNGDRYEQLSDNPFNPRSFNINLDLDYYVHPKHTIGTLFQYSKDSDTWLGNSTILVRSVGQTDQLQSTLDTREDWSFWSINPYYEWRWKEDGDDFLRFDVRYLSYHSNEENIFRSLSGSTLDYVEPAFFQKGNNQIWSYKLDFSKVLSSAHTMKMGFKYDVNDLDNAIRNFINNDGTLEPNSEFDNQFLIDEDIFATYLQYKYNNEDWNLMIGLRWESSTTKGKSDRVDQSTIRKFNNLFPSFSLTYPIAEDWGGSFAYSYRINRPGYYSLNPFRVFYDPLLSDAGNPQLIPQFSHSFQLNLLQDQSPLLRINYRRSTNVLFERITQDDDNGETQRQNINIDNSDFFSIGLQYAIESIPNVFLSGGVTARYQKYTAELSDFVFNNSKWSAIWSQSFEFNLPWKIGLEGRIWASTGRLNGMMDTQWYGGAYFEVNRSFLDKKLRVSLEFEDLIRRGFVHEVQFNNIDATFNNRWNFGNFYLRFRYFFGKNYVKDNSDRKRDSDGLDRIR